MRKNKMKRKLKRSEPVFGSMINLADPGIVEIFGHTGYDFVIVDTEHSPQDMETVENMVRAAEVSDITILVRVPDLNPKHILRLLECGVQGIMLPQTETREMAEELVSAMKYSPEGNRGIHLAVKATGYASSDPFQHFKESNAETFVGVLVETAKGVENVEEILKVRGLDMVFVGNYDLSSSLGVIGRVQEPVVAKAIEKVIKAVKRNGRVRAGMPAATPEAALSLVKQGFRFIMYPPADTFFFKSSLQGALQAARKLIK